MSRNESDLEGLAKLMLSIQFIIKIAINLFCIAIIFKAFTDMYLIYCSVKG